MKNNQLHRFFTDSIVCVCVRVVLVSQLCVTFCNPLGCSPPGSSGHGILQGKNTGVDCHSLLLDSIMCCAVFIHSVMSNSANPWVIAWQTPLSMRFSRQEYWSGLPCPLPGDLPILGIKPRSPALQVNSLPSEPPEKPKNTGVGSLSIFQGVCPTQESNWGLPHCRQILYQLSYQRSQRVSYLGLNSNRD